MPNGKDPSANTLLKMLRRDPRQQQSGILGCHCLIPPGHKYFCFRGVFPVSGVEDTKKTSHIPVFPARKSVISDIFLFISPRAGLQIDIFKRQYNTVRLYIIASA
jgi:hypothetical protein